MNPAALLHDGADQTALGANEGVVQLGRDGDLYLGYVGQVFLNRQNPAPGRFAVGSLACDDDGL